MLEFLVFLEVFSLLTIFFLFLKISSFDYSLILKILVLISCESAIGLSLLVIYIRKFRVDKIKKIFFKKRCEGF
jgi:NADH:ubiquinone oxidoreductase subunit K